MLSVSDSPEHLPKKTLASPGPLAAQYKLKTVMLTFYSYYQLLSLLPIVFCIHTTYTVVLLL